MNKKFVIEYEQKTPMGMSSRNNYKWDCETNSAFNAMRRFESEYKEYIGYDWMGEPKSVYQITGWDIVEIDGFHVERKWNEKKCKYEYLDCNGVKRG